MTREDFWQLIESSREPGQELDLKRLEAALVAAGPEVIIAFDRMFYVLHHESYSWHLWGAAYIQLEGCSNDSFDYFRAWLIGKGRETYTRVLENPDELADVADDGPGERVMYVARRAHERATGTELPREPGPRRPELGERWDFDDLAECQRRYPKLSAKFLQAP